MKLQIRIVNNEFKAVPTLVLCDDTGEPLPNQTEIEIYNSVADKTPKVRVTFAIDQDQVQLVK